MDEPEKITALKIAYADTLLNTAKEAAARVMVSEERTRGYQQELFSIKDEALRMLLRLKQMYDAKVHEAEIKSLIQQRKIEELEAQLGEAEDIVKDLRMELRELRDLFIKFTKNQAQVQCKQDPNLETQEASVIRSEPRPDPAVNSVTKDSVANKYDPNRCSDTDNCHACNSGFASIMLRRKGGRELFRNGCTQRILALDGDIMNGSPYHVDKPDDSENKLLFREGSNLDDCAAVQNSSTEAKVNDVELAALTKKDASRHTNSKPQVSVNTMPQTPETLQRIHFSGGQSCVSEGNDEPRAMDTSSLACPTSIPSSDTVAKNCEELSKTDVEALGKVPEAVKAPELIEAMPLQPVTNKIIKYTFERKRKKESPDKGSSHENSTPCKKRNEGEKGLLECLKPGSLIESSCNSQQLTQVSQKLVSLGEKEG